MIIKGLYATGLGAILLSSSASAVRSVPPRYVPFASGSAVPGPGAQKAVRAAITSDYIKDPGFIVSGYTDTVGEASANRRLSCRRAQAVRDLLVRQGVPPSYIALFAFGEERPRLSTEDEVAEARNRRVEIENYPRGYVEKQQTMCV